MRAAWYERVGAARDVMEVGEMEIPEVSPGQVRVRVYASGVNPSDIKRRTAFLGAKMTCPRIIPHQDGAGIIEAVGEGVSSSRIGERVWLYEAQLRQPFGTAAEFVVLPSEQAVYLPDGTDFAEGACLGVPAITSHYCIFADGPVTGQTILVAGGAGAVGNYAIQFAKWGGATVITTVSSSEKAELALAAGADYTINYRTEDVVSRVREITGDGGVDRVVEVAFGRNIPTDVAILKPNGAIATYASDADREPQLPFYPLMSKCITIHFVLVYALSKAAHQAAVQDITTCLEQGVLRHAIAHRFPLSEVAAAHEAVESGQSLGNIIVETI